MLLNFNMGVKEFPNLYYSIGPIEREELLTTQNKSISNQTDEIYIIFLFAYSSIQGDNTECFFSFFRVPQAISQSFFYRF